MPNQSRAAVERNARPLGRGKHVLSIALAGSLFAPLSALAAQTMTGPPISVNGASTSSSALEKDNSTLVPIHGVFDKIGTVVTFTAPSTIVATQKTAEIARMTVGSRTATVKGATAQLPVAPLISHGQVMVPLRFLAETAGASVAYSASPRGVQVTRPSEIAQAVAPATAATAAADTAVVAAPATAADTQSNQGGIPWWVWLLAALVIVGLLLAFMRRKKEPIITTSGAGKSREPIIKTRG